MDRTESKIRLDEISELIANGRIEDAENLLDGINWRKVHNVSSLLKASELYERIEQYEDAKELLEIAHERSPIGRMIIFRLAIVSIRLGELNEAKDYYDEFLEVAPHDSLKYIINFELSKAREESDLTLIAILEELRESDFSEEWAFELACLYHKTGQVDKCISLCDEIILWFGEGPYVEKALELKMLYRPLDTMQEDKYRKISGVTEIHSDEFEGTGEVLAHTIKIPEISIRTQEKFNTTNLQAEIKKNIEEIMQASEVGEVSENMDAIKDLVDEIPYLSIDDDTDKEALKRSDTQKLGEMLRDRYKQYLSEEFDGQMSLYMPEETPEEPQVDGQMTIEEVMEQWEKTKRAAEATLSDAKELELLQYKERAIEEASRLLDRLIQVSPQLDAGILPSQLLKDEYLSRGEVPMTIPEPEIELQIEEEPSPEHGAEPQIEEEPIPEPEAELQIEEEPTSEPEVEPRIEEEPISESDAEPQIEEEPTPEPEAKPEIEEPVKTGKTFSIPVIDSTGAEEDSWEIPVITVDKEDLLSDSNFEEKNKEEEIPKIGDMLEQEEIKTSLTPEEIGIFSYFSHVTGMETAICQLLTGVKTRIQTEGSVGYGNIIIQGRKGNGKTRLATNIIRALQNETGKPKGSVGKISGSKLNEKDIKQLFEKIKGGCLIIEGAGALEKETIVSLTLMMEHDRSGILVILEDTRINIEKLLNSDGRFAKKFTEKITIPVMTIDELVRFGKIYADENGYSIDEMGVLALYDKINLSQRIDNPTCIGDVKEIIDDAIANQKSGRHKGLFKIFGSKAQEDTDKPVLQERDFQDE